MLFIISVVGKTTEELLEGSEGCQSDGVAHLRLSLRIVETRLSVQFKPTARVEDKCEDDGSDDDRLDGRGVGDSADLQCKLCERDSRKRFYQEWVADSQISVN